METPKEIQGVIKKFEQEINSGDENPYIYKLSLRIERRYNPDFGDDKICECGHSYYRHFDTYEKMEAVGCKYCQCYEFKEKKMIKTEPVQEDLVSIEVAQLLKKNGFNNQCFDYFEPNGKCGRHTAGYMGDLNGFLHRPTQALVVKWLRINHNVLIEITTSGDEASYPLFGYIIVDLKNPMSRVKTEMDILEGKLFLGECETPEEATEAAILYCLRNLLK